MYPAELFSILDVAAVQSVFGTPVRIYPFGDARPNELRPYAVHQLIVGTPLNCLDDPPPADDERIQFSIWGDSTPQVLAAVVALRACLQGYGYINSYSDAGRDPETKRYGMIIDWSRLEPWPIP